MPWNDQSKPGPWGSPPSQGGSGGGGGRGPRRPNLGGAGSGGGPPDLEQWARRAGDRLKQFFQEPDGRWRPSAFGAVAGGVLGLWLLSGIYVVQPDQQAVVTTFGAYSRTEGPGLRYHVPAPVEQVRKWQVTSLQSLDIGGGAEPDLNESLMLTGDENIVDLRFAVQWRIVDPGRYQFQISDPEDTLKDVAESAMREVVGQIPLEAILTTGRSQVEQRAEALMRRTLDAYGSGIEISEVQIRSAAPPSEVVGAFREVASAGQQAEASVNEARGEAARLAQSALGYRGQVVREAEGEAARFNQLYEQSPRVSDYIWRRWSGCSPTPTR
jgi:modulator of FtsH protease HflK